MNLKLVTSTKSLVVRNSSTEL